MNDRSIMDLLRTLPWESHTKSGRLRLGQQVVFGEYRGATSRNIVSGGL